MSAVKIDFSDLHDAARRARDAAGEMEAYRDALPGSVTNPLGSLTGGSSGNTSNVQALANRKRQQLQNRADAYRQFSTKLDNFADHAKSTDEEVKRVIERVADKRSESLNWFQQFLYQGYKFMNGIFGATEFGAFVNNVIGFADYVIEKHVKGVLDWFKHGDGKYVLNIAIAALGIITAIAGAIALFPVSTVLGAIVAIATVASAVVTVADSMSEIIGNIKALKYNNTDPGLARYHGNVGSLEDYAKRETTNAGLQAVATGIDITGKVTGAVAFVGNFGLAEHDGVKKLATSQEIKKNIGKKFGFVFDGDSGSWKFGTKTFFGLVEPGIGENPAEKVKAFNLAKEIDDGVSPLERSLKFFQSTLKLDGKFDGFSDVKNATKTISSFAPSLKGYDKVLGWLDDLHVSDVLDDAGKSAKQWFVETSALGGAR